MIEKRGINSSIYNARCGFVAEHTDDYDFLLDVWLKKKDFTGLAHIMIDVDANNCHMAGNIAHRAGDTQTAFHYWSLAKRAMNALDVAVSTRLTLPSDTVYPIQGAETIPARYFYKLAVCLLFSGDRQGISRLRGYLDLPFTAMASIGSKELDITAAETLIIFAAWEGDAVKAESLYPVMEKEYKRYRIPDIHVKLWQAVVLRDNEKLSSLLSEVDDVYKKAARRKEYDMYGGGTDYNSIMFNSYVTVVLKIAKEVGMNWSYDYSNSSDLLPLDVITYWQ